jgi:hypothetical protein
MLVMLGSIGLAFSLFYLFFWWKRDAGWYRNFRANTKSPFSLIGFLGLFIVAVPLLVFQVFLVLSVVVLVVMLVGFLLAFIAINHASVRGLGAGLFISGVVVLIGELAVLLLLPAFGAISYVIGSGLVVVSVILFAFGLGHFPVPKFADGS